MNDQAPLGQRPPGYDRALDRMIYWTLSLYVPKERMKALLGGDLRPAQAAAVQAGDPHSLALRDAIDPLFNDIADRERLGRVDDILLATPGPLQGENIDISVPPEIEWQTEGKLFRTSPPGLSTPRRTVLRRFWYVHLDGAMSYHLSFQQHYAHAPGDFFFLSMMQKVLAPKEFRRDPVAGAATVSPFDAAPTGCLPIDATMVCDADTGAQRFWHFVKARFEQDMGALAPKLISAAGRVGRAPGKVVAEDLITQSPYVEVPGLIMPAARFMFFFQDALLFRRLMPPVPAGGTQRPSLAEMCQEQCYTPYTRKIVDLAAQGGEQQPPCVDMDDGYWDWVLTRPDYRDHFAADSAAETQRQIDAAFRDIPAFEGDLSRPDCLQYMFLAGFNQNIIDFMNQDASEVQDSLDPIYPTNERQEEECFFVRYANLRALITYVRQSRSLEIGQDYIGTCPYAFLIHVSALHNEFLTRAYETKTFRLIDDMRNLNERRTKSEAAQAFYDFRMGPYADYRRNRYLNIFRYDTERDVFDALDQLRGTARRDEFLEVLVSNVESQTRDLEARNTQSEEKRLNYVLGALGILGLFQLTMSWADRLRADDSPLKAGGWRALITPEAGQGLADGIELWTLRASVVFFALLLLYAAYLLIRRLRR